MKDWKTFGHGAVKKILELQCTSGHFSHAYLFVGPEGVGKYNIALEFAAKILQTENAEQHADFSQFDAEAETGSEKFKDFIETLHFSPFVGKYKVAVIDNSQSLNTQSLNALLKTLEEPSSSTVIILVSSSSALIPTIVSRCQVFTFGVFSTKELLEFAEYKKIKPTEDTLQFSYNIPGRLVKIQESKQKGYEKTLKEKLVFLKNASVAERLLFVSEYAELEDSELKEILVNWTFMEKQMLAQYPIKKTLEALTISLHHMETNKNKKLILQSLFLGL